jgi:hypothetical protein
MSLPKIDLPVYTTNIHSKKLPIQFTPFTVKESTILMMAKESGEVQAMIDAIRQILTNCLVDKSIVVNKLPMIDLEWLFIQIHSKSSGETVPLHFKCKNITNKETVTECGMILQCEIDLRNIKYEPLPKDYGRFMLTEHIGIQMKLPTFEATQKALNVPQSLQDHMLAGMCIDYVFDETTVTNADDAEPEELMEFVQGIELANFNKIKDFLDEVPTIKYVIETTCGKCDYHHNIVLEGLADFFE